MIEGAVVLLAGMVAGWWLDRRMVNYQLQHGAAVAKASKPTCSCGDPPSLHDPKTKQCHGERYLKGDGGWKEWRRCTCRQYDGPEPLPEFYAPEIGP